MSAGERFDRFLDNAEKAVADLPSMVLGYIFLTMALLVLIGCVGNAPAPISSACAWIKIIHPSQQDTVGTLRQIDEHNKAVRANCPGL